VRDGRLIQHQQVFPTLGTSLPCVGSHSKAPDDPGDQRPPRDRPDAELHPRPFVNRPRATISR